MRILFTTIGRLGHFHLLVPSHKRPSAAVTRWRLPARSRLVHAVEASGFHAVISLRDDGPDPERMAVMQRIGQLPPGEQANTVMMADVFIGSTARRALPVVLEFCQRWQPDLIVREDCEFAGAIAAEHLELPHAAVQVSYSYNWQNFRGTAVEQRLDELRHMWGLPPDPSLAMLFRYLFLSFDPPSFADRAALPPTTLHLRTSIFDRSSAETLPRWVEGATHPLIYATLGSEAPKMPWIFPAAYVTILEGLREEPGTVALTIREDRDPVEIGLQPAACSCVACESKRPSTASPLNRHPSRRRSQPKIGRIVHCVGAHSIGGGDGPHFGNRAGSVEWTSRYRHWGWTRHWAGDRPSARWSGRQSCRDRSKP